jgi:hypothetical protein
MTERSRLAMTVPKEKMVPLPALQESRNQNRRLKARISAMEVERASVQAFLKQLGFSISEFFNNLLGDAGNASAEAWRRLRR